jgi:hypothetical protein
MVVVFMHAYIDHKLQLQSKFFFFFFFGLVILSS